MERLRWVLAGGAVLLLVVLAVFLGYGRYRALRTWRDIVRRSGAHITHETDGYTYSQSLKGRTIFTLHAAKGIPHGDGKWSLHDGVLTLYGKTPNDFDRIHGADFEYDEKTEILQALGEVYIDVQAPGALASGGKTHTDNSPKTPMAQPDAKPGENDHIIHVRTTGLSYNRKEGIATTSEEVEFRYAGLQCLAKGAIFNSDESMLHLLADVRLTGDVHGEPMTVHAVKADLNRESNTVALVQPVAHTQGRTAHAASALLHLRKDGSISQAEADGNVAFDEGTRHLTAPHLDATFNTASLPQTTKLTGGVVLWDDNVQQPMHGKANEVDTSFNALGAPTNIVATGAAQVALSDHKGSGPALSREMRGDRIVATLVPIGHKTVSRLTQVVATGSAMARGDSPVASSAGHPQTQEIKSTMITADKLRADLEPGASQKAELRKVFGTGHARLQQDAPQGEQQTSSSDTVDIAFASQPTKSGGMATGITSAVQNGHVVIHSVPALRVGAAKPEPPSDASANNAVYDGATSKLTLTGSARYTQGDTQLTAATIVANQTTGDADAQGNVLATLLGAETSATAQATHVTADHAHLVQASQVADFYGNEAHPARLWQGASQVEAATLRFDQKQKTLAARPASTGGLVHAVFANANANANSNPSQAQAKGKTASSGEGQVVRVASPAMDYSDIAREATFSGGVRIDGATGQARSQKAVVFLNPAAPSKAAPGAAKPAGPTNLLGGSVEKVVLSESVRIDQPGRAGTGEQLVYTTADSSYILTGTPAKPPHIVDVKQGNVTGATLLFRSDDSTIIVTGAPPGPAQKHGRVRTETEVRQ
ncbi:LptA/OstA family protein [Granulicella mallensis]|uniref:Lipopolysaccharide export system protein LptA n=1 Tax=Granulicella mallensis TaxID=940614 RepID=A0A7W7ZUQ1_9BACT|nr:LptA/OstA family protein [Granulicella mallensis]MBB5066532.1 lipopolysaccharide export system protein LptA [Granulicella mallensis]